MFTFLSVHDSNGLNLAIAARKLGSKHISTKTSDRKLTSAFVVYVDMLLLLLLYSLYAWYMFVILQNSD